MTWILTRATNPTQYDLPDLDWSKDKVYPKRELYFDYYLFKNIADLRDKSCLDVGCAAGQTMQGMIDNGAKNVMGIEPSKRNIELARRRFKNLKIEKTSLQDFRTDKKFDIITAVMVLVHLPSLDYAFKKIRTLLKSDGLAYFIVEDFEYMKTPRYDYKIHSEKLNDNEIAIAVNRYNGVIADIIRPITYYKSQAKKTGLKLKKHVKMTFPEKFLQSAPRYRVAEALTVNHLLIYLR